MKDCTSHCFIPVISFTYQVYYLRPELLFTYYTTRLSCLHIIDFCPVLNFDPEYNF